MSRFLVTALALVPVRWTSSLPESISLCSGLNHRAKRRIPWQSSPRKSFPSCVNWPVICALDHFVLARTATATGDSVALPAPISTWRCPPNEPEVPRGKQVKNVSEPSSVEFQLASRISTSRPSSAGRILRMTSLAHSFWLNSTSDPSSKEQIAQKK